MLDRLFDKLQARRERFVSDAKSAILRVLVGRTVEVPEAERTHDRHDLERRTDELNVAAERYFAAGGNPEFLTRKPYSDPINFPKYLFNLGLLIHAGRIAPGHRVLEMGAGSAWVSHFLNLYGCATISLDVSRTALELAEETFRLDSRTRWDLAPAFLTYDGHTIPLEDGSCDRVIIHDAFHHIPNQEEILREMARVLVQGGIVAMNEPGRAHSASPASRRDMTDWGVLENDIVVEDLADLAEAAGFTETTVVPINLNGAEEIPARDLISFVRGRRLAEWWNRMAPHLLNEHYIFLHKGESRLDTRSPGRLRAEIEPRWEGDETALRVAAGVPARLRCRVCNAGDTVWLAQTTAGPGATQVGAYLREPWDETTGRDWARVGFVQDIAPGEEAEVELELPALEASGRYVVELDLVAEGVTWFAEAGSETAQVPLIVE